MLRMWRHALNALGRQVRKARNDFDTQVRRIKAEADEALRVAQQQQTASLDRDAAEEVHRLRAETAAAKEHIARLQAESQQLRGTCDLSL